ncbi:XRE family transcriptional regulator [Sodalis praecaptivus]|uniref:XRE family transcriptional regulator n=1 Tax=Sodalis praecaptivus TaxID=1239307 RepID=W0HX05_9GAMM|nr:XRE family transcriptional regulator [Sodalis praecaptivus]AHF77032.1 XRE family transcriptional regulator [Sodalis praecaptivus]
MTSGSEEITRKTLSRQLKARRKELNYSLQTLAELSGVSVSMISRTERGEVTPSTSVLSRLVNALDLSFAGLMSSQMSDDIVVIRSGTQPVLEDKHNRFTRTCLSPILPGRGIDVVKVNLGAFSGSGELVGHTQPVKEYIYILAGCVDVTVGEAVSRLNAGDSMFYTAKVRHGFYNPAQDDCEFLLVIDGKQN